MSDLPKLSEIRDGLKAISEHFQGETVIYTAPTPPYIVQELQVEYNNGWVDPSETWLDIKGFQVESHARAHADDVKRRNPATDYRVVKTGE